MSNPHRGEVSFEASGQQWTLAYSVNALCELEDELKLGINEIAELLSDAKKMRLKTMRAVLWAGLKDHHPDIEIRQAGELIAVLSVIGASDVIGRAITLAFPEGEGKGKDPQQPGAINGTGRDSTAPGAASAVTKKRSGEKHPGKSA